MSKSIEIKRHRAARNKSKLAPLFRYAIDRGILQSGMSVLDYGCGKGNDFNYLAQLGYDSDGYDPHYYPHPPERDNYDIVALNYVVNVIENPLERLEVLRYCWNLASHALLVGFPERVLPSSLGIDYNDGRVSKSIFNRQFSRNEISEIIENATQRLPLFLDKDTLVVRREFKELGDKYNLITYLHNDKSLTRWQRNRLKMLIRQC